MDKKYKIIIYWSSEDNAYVAEVPDLEGCMADLHMLDEKIAQPNTAQDAKQSAPVNF